ncbi:integrase catalytic domain-containing protein [Trichonephila clavipes]|nr:integrase catalytic domain-containing protein [Trichonephila clavipes]
MNIHLYIRCTGRVTIYTSASQIRCNRKVSAEFYPVGLLPWRQYLEGLCQEWKREGIIEEVPKEELKSVSHYLPHRHVGRPNSTTKIRPVFNASSKQKGAVSLNNCLEKALNLIELIPSRLARIRLYRFGVSADIRKAFLQISLNQQD